jgi:hypothetical protein
MYKSILEIGGKQKTIVVVNYKTEQEMSQSKSVDCLHHVHIIDRSGSMSGSISELIENVKQTIEFIPDNDYVSIIWFSSSGQFKTLIKGAKKDVGLFTLLDSIKFTIGCTCFSESLVEVGVIIADLSTICPNFNVTLFTDGQPVVPWSEDEEIKRIHKAIDAWKDKVIALNTVGYGNYYNEQLLKDIASKSMFGQMVHSSKIGEYMDIFSHNYERVSDLVMDSVSFESVGSEIIYLNSKTSKMGLDTMKMSMLEKKKNQFILLNDKPDFEFTMNDITFSSNSISGEIPKASQTPISYVYAYENYYKGNRQYALDTLSKTLKDKFLIDEQIKAFTFDECSDYMKKFKKAVFSTKSRLLQGECPNDYIPKEDATCIMDILKILVEGENSYVYSSGYKRIGIQTIDTFNLFEKSKEQAVTPLKGLIFNKEKLNISVGSEISGKVKLNPKQAGRVGLPTQVDSYVHRTQTIIKDGNLNLEEITVILDDTTLKNLNDLHIPGLILTTEVDKCFVVDLTVLPVINRTYLSEAGNIENVMKNTMEIMTLEAHQKVANYFLKQLKKESPTDFIPTQYTPEQLEVLKDHGLTSKLCYEGVGTEKAVKVDDDYYEARELTFNIKGYATLPPIDKLLKKIKENGKLNGPEIIMKSYIMETQQDINMNMDSESKPVSLLDIISFPNALEYFEKETRRIKRDILEKRIEMCSMKIAKVLTGDWFSDLIPDGKGNYNYIKEGNTLVVKTEKVKVFFS